MEELTSHIGKKENVTTGKIGEALSCNILKGKGYKIITVNFKTIIGEIDIIAKDKDTLVFVEVKMRKNLNNGYPREAVNSHKQNKIRAVAEQYVNRNAYNGLCRFDVLEIIGTSRDYTFEHIINAF